MADGTPARVEGTSTKRALAFVYVGYAFRYLYLLILVPFYGRVLGASEYGRVLAAMSLYQIVWMLVEYGYPPAGARDIAASNEPHQLAHVYARHVMGRLVMLVPALLIGIGGTLLSPLLRERPVFGVLATVTGVISGFNLGWYFQGILRFRTSVVLEMVGFAINLPLILLLVRGPHDGFYVLFVLAVSGLLCTGAAHLIAIRSLDRKALRWSGGIELVRASTALFAHKGLTMVMASSSTYLISLFANAQQVGWYGAAERLVSVGLSLLQPANQVLIGTVSRRIQDSSSEGEAYTLIRKGLFVLTGFGFFLLFGSLALASTMVPLILGPSFGPTVPMLQVLSLMFPFAALSGVITGYVLIPLRHDALVSKVTLFTATITVVLIATLGKAFGGMGVAWARSLGYVLTAGLLVQVLRRKQLARRILTAV